MAPRLLRQLRLLDFDLLTDPSSSLPDKSAIADGSLTLVENGSIKKWACLKCPGGCGEVINLSLNPDRRPRWTVCEDIWSRPSVYPSVHQQSHCGCHFWIKKGRIRWCNDGRPRPELQVTGRNGWSSQFSPVPHKGIPPSPHPRTAPRGFSCELGFPLRIRQFQSGTGRGNESDNGSSGS